MRNNDWILGNLIGKNTSRGLARYYIQGVRHVRPGRIEHEYQGACMLSPSFPIPDSPKIAILDLQLFTVRGLGGII